MLVKFKNIGRNNISFERERKYLNYDWLISEVQPYLLSHNIDILENKKGTLTVFAGMQTVGEIEVCNNGKRKDTNISR